MSTTTMTNNIYRRIIKLIGTLLRLALRILQTTVNDSLYKAGLITYNKLC